MSSPSTPKMSIYTSYPVLQRLRRQQSERKIAAKKDKSHDDSSLPLLSQTPPQASSLQPKYRTMQSGDVRNIMDLWKSPGSMYCTMALSAPSRRSATPTLRRTHTAGALPGSNAPAPPLPSLRSTADFPTSVRGFADAVRRAAYTSTLKTWIPRCLRLPSFYHVQQISDQPAVDYGMSHVGAEEVIKAWVLWKVNHRLAIQRRVLLLTTSAFYTYNLAHTSPVMKAHPLASVTSIHFGPVDLTAHSTPAALRRHTSKLIVSPLNHHGHPHPHPHAHGPPGMPQIAIRNGTAQRRCSIDDIAASIKKVQVQANPLASPSASPSVPRPIPRSRSNSVQQAHAQAHTPSIYSTSSPTQLPCGACVSGVSQCACAKPSPLGGRVAPTPPPPTVANGPNTPSRMPPLPPPPRTDADTPIHTSTHTSHTLDACVTPTSTHTMDTQGIVDPFAPRADGGENGPKTLGDLAFQAMQIAARAETERKDKGKDKDASSPAKAHDRDKEGARHGPPTPPPAPLPPPPLPHSAPAEEGSPLGSKQGSSKPDPVPRTRSRSSPHPPTFTPATPPAPTLTHSPLSQGPTQQQPTHTQAPAANSEDKGSLQGYAHTIVIEGTDISPCSSLVHNTRRFAVCDPRSAAIAEEIAWAIFGIVSTHRTDIPFPIQSSQLLSKYHCNKRHGKPTYGTFANQN